MYEIFFGNYFIKIIKKVIFEGLAKTTFLFFFPRTNTEPALQLLRVEKEERLVNVL